MRELLPVFDRTDTGHIQFIYDCICMTTGDVMELGVDPVATPLLRAATRALGRRFVSYDTSLEAVRSVGGEDLGSDVYLLGRYAALAQATRRDIRAASVGCAILRAGALADKAALLTGNGLGQDLAVVVGTGVREASATPSWALVSREFQHSAVFVGASPWVTALSTCLKLTRLAELEYDRMLARFHALEIR